MATKNVKEKPEVVLTPATAHLRIGETAPDFALPADDGSVVRLSDLRGKRVVLFFYPADDTPACTNQACGFRDNYLAIEEQNAIVLGISPDDVTSHRKFRTKYDLPYLLLADTDHAVAELYGVWGEKTLYAHHYMGVVRSHFIVDEAGKLADVRYKIAPKESIKRALGALEA